MLDNFDIKASRLAAGGAEGMMAKPNGREKNPASGRSRRVQTTQNRAQTDAQC